MGNSVRNTVKALLVLVLCFVVVRPGEAPATDKLARRAQISELLNESRDKLAEGQYDSVPVHLEQVQQLDPKNPDAIYYTALVYIAKSDTAQARHVLTEGIAKAPLSTRVRLLLVRLQLDAGEYDEAEESLATMLRFKPNNAEALYLKGFVSLARGDTTATLDDWQTALEKVRSGRSAR
jgi:cytochrome c-type biogenesis protein CcmH/NrfG